MIGFVRSATVLEVAVIAALAIAACNDVHDFRGSWTGARVGDIEVVREGGPRNSTAVLTIDDVDSHGMAGTIAVEGMVAETTFTSLAGAEADVLSGMTFAGSPLRVYLSFVETTDGGGAALAVIALYPQHRVELRVLRGAPLPMYGIFSLSEGTP